MTNIDILSRTRRAQTALPWVKSGKRRVRSDGPAGACDLIA